MVEVTAIKMDLPKFGVWAEKFKFVKQSARKVAAKDEYRMELADASELLAFVKAINGKMEGFRIRAQGYRVAEFRQL